MAGFNFTAVVRAGGPPLAGGGVVPTGRSGAFSPGVVGWCGVVARLWACFYPLRAVRRLVRVKPTFSVPCLGAVVCFGVPCCAVLCFAMLRRAFLGYAAVRFSLPCRGAPCHAVVCPALAWWVAPCCAAPRCVVLCPAVSRGALWRCAAQWCVVLRCAVLRRAVSCFAVPACVVGPSYLRSGVGWRRRPLDWWLCCVGCGLRLCGRLLAGGRGLAWCGSLGLCFGDLGVPFGLVGQAYVRGVALP